MNWDNEIGDHVNIGACHENWYVGCPHMFFEGITKQCEVAPSASWYTSLEEAELAWNCKAESKIYAVQYSDCVHERGFDTISIHSKKSDAYKSISLIKNNNFNEKREDRRLFGDPYKGEKYSFEWQQYRILEMKLCED